MVVSFAVNDKKALPKKSIALGVPNAFLQSVSWACAIGGFLFGYSASVINGSLPFMEKELALSSLTKGVVTSSILVGAACGAFIGGKLADIFGRKRLMICFDLIFIVGTICTTFSPNTWTLLVSRILLGFAAGGHSSVGPVFLAEISTAETRSKNVTLNILLIVFGELFAFIVNAALGILFYNYDPIWRWMNAFVLLPAILLLICHCFLVPESPRWLVSSKQMDRAFDTLRKLRKTTMQTEREIKEIGSVAGAKEYLSDDSKNQKIGLKGILQCKWMRSLLLIGIGIAVTQQIYGICIAMYYGTEILRGAGMNTQIALLANISIGVVSFLATWAGLHLIDKMGRRKLLILGQFGAIFSHLMIAICSYFVPEGTIRAWSTLGLLLVFLIFFQGSISPVTWLLLAEIFPLNIRGIAMGLSTLVIWATNCCQGLIFPLAMENLHQHWTFGLLAFFGTLSLLFVWIWLPETRRKSLEELEKQFQESDWTKLKIEGDGTLKNTTKPLDKIEEEEEYSILKDSALFEEKKY